MSEHATPVALMQQLHDEHAGALWGYCLRLTGNDRARAEDLLQETLLRAWRSSRLLDESRGSVRSWLFTVARHLAIDEWRTKRSRTEMSMAELPEPPASGDRDHTDQLLQSWVVADALAKLSDDHR
ncbi:MAG: polymerase sigma-70 factor, subfamily, partial [Thermoleophilaceae bacterium]|nr:polymerase sigma-70 factor, subfamily [Thermoleophilaceae bacterium]